MKKLLLTLTLIAATPYAAGFTATSTSFTNGGPLPMQQVGDTGDCKGGTLSPQISWANAPEGTKSYAVTMYDPDAPTGSGWWHWVVFNIPPNTTSLPKDAGDVKKKLMPKGAIQSRTDFGSGGYGGPCP